MATRKAAAPVDTTLGQKAHALATTHRADLEPRLPPATIDDLGSDLATLGAGATGSPAPPPAPPVPSLGDALGRAANLVTAIHAAVLAATPKASVRSAYGASSKAAGKEAKRVLASANKILAAAQADPPGALALGILPADGTALGQAAHDLQAAMTAAAAHAGKTGPTATQKRAATTRMHAAVARIAGAGMLAYAQNASVRAEFEALRVKKKA